LTIFTYNARQKTFGCNKHICRSFDTLIPSISLSFGSIIATLSHMYSEPALIIVSSFCIQEYSETFFFL
jgi:hypothetical protein